MLLSLVLATVFVSLGCLCTRTGLQSGDHFAPHTHQKLLPGKCEAVYASIDSRRPSVPPPPLEVIPLVVSGPANNRVDLVFFSDGYLSEERDKFIADALRLAKEISSNHTFATVQPLLNFWAAFTPSNESGVGVGGKPKDTPFGLYRDGTELRAVYYQYPEVAAAACSSLGDQCDYPILLGNDPLYGGLGGDFTVVTSSLANGPLVLRHELGHSIIGVGEEYDGGPGYFGVNAYHNLSQPVPWAHWLSPTPAELAKPRVERTVMPMQLYPWTMLNTTTPWAVRFTSSGVYSRHLVRFSLSGLPEASDIRVELDGTDLEWVPRSDIGVDRWHYDIFNNHSLTPGQHEVKFTLFNGQRVGTAQLCSVEILEFGNEKEFVSTPGQYGVFPTFSDKNVTSYRPTNGDCLMRIVTVPDFCKVCIEGLWLSLLRRVNIIDSVKEGCQQRPSSGRMRTLDVQLVPLAQYRQKPINHEALVIKWWKDGKALTKFTNKTRVEVKDTRAALGTYSVQVRFSTDEVRVDKENQLTSTLEHKVTQACVASS